LTQPYVLYNIKKYEVTLPIVHQKYAFVLSTKVQENKHMKLIQERAINIQTNTIK
jgi:hypothetical protein